MMHPRVSILIPAYNQPENLRYALQSISRQTFKDFQVVIPDDTRDDAIFNVIQEFRHLPLTYHKNKWTLGSPANWNEAIRISNGDYIKFLHHDDWFTRPESLELFVRALDENPQANIAFSTSNGCGMSRKPSYEHRPTPQQISRLKNDAPAILSRANIIGAPSATIYRRSIDMKFDTRLKWLVDVDFYIRVLRKNPEFVFINDDLVNCLVSEQSVSHGYQNSLMKRVYENVYLGLKNIGSV